MFQEAEKVKTSTVIKLTFHHNQTLTFTIIYQMNEFNNPVHEIRILFSICTSEETRHKL